MPLTEILDLNKAFRRIDKDRRDDAWPDIVGYRDYKRDLDGNLERVRLTLRDPRQYQTNSPLAIDIPKRGFLLRPGIVPLIDDRIVYQAIADTLAPLFQPEPSVFSNRLAGINSNQMFLPGVELWIQFQDRIAECCQQFPFVVETDLTAYFDHIKHDLLFSRIRDLFGRSLEGPIIDEMTLILERLLGRWSAGGLREFGIPQINDASSFMGNLFLDELDKWFLAHRLTSLRYVDDIRVFAESEAQARKILADLIVRLRSMGLYIASGKTKIQRSFDVLQELEVGRHRVAQIEANLDTCDPQRMEQAAQDLSAFFLELVAAPVFNDRQFRFCVNRFKKLQVTGIGLGIQDRVIDEVLARLSVMPESTDVFVDYLSLFSARADVQERVITFLEGPYNIYPWQEMQLLELLIRSQIDAELRIRVNQFASEKIQNAAHPACRAKAIILRGKNGSYADRREIRDSFHQEDREDIRRAIIIAVQEMQESERNHFYQTIARESLGIQRTAGYIQNLGQPTYCYYNPPSAYDVIPPDQDDSDDLPDLGSEYFI